MNLLIERLVRAGMRQGWRRGVVEGHPAWTVVGGVTVLAYLAGRVLKRDEQVIFSEKLAPGQVIRISHESPS